MRDTQPVRVRIGIFELDLKSGELRCGVEKTLLPEQPLQILRMLVERDGELVSREEIRKKLWPNDTIVEFDHSINAAIRILRRALGDSADEPKYIETLARRGYRLMVRVEWISSAEDPPVQAAAKAAAGDGGSPPPFSPQATESGGLEPQSAGLTGRTVSHYRVLDVVGGGGMGVVYRAEDLKLGRQVALKFLPEELGSDAQALERFSREARAASALDHPNICPIFQFGDHEGRPFIVMQLLEGQTLRDRLVAVAEAQTALPLEELLDIGIQVSEGLQAAHEKGIIHRDIKPANIFLTNKGVVKILDFGLAKLLESSDPETKQQQVPRGPKHPGDDGNKLLPGAPEGAPVQADDPAEALPEELNGSRPAPPADAGLTGIGVAMGTAGYMSPEQVRGEKLDARTDIFSLGLILYEMATGRRAFSGDTAVVVHGAILNQPPIAIHDLNSLIPPKLENSIAKALDKDRKRRYQSAAEMTADLEAVQRLLLTPKPPSLEAVPTRQRKLRQLAAVVALVCAISAGIWWWLRPPKITDIVLADFTNATSDSNFDNALNTALRTELEQTPYLNLLAGDKVRGILKSLNYPESQRLTPEVARAVCLRSNSKAVVGGSIRDVGNRYRIEVKATDCKTGKTLVATSLETANRDEIVKTLGMAGSELRRKLGEPRESLQRFNQPLDQATSASVEALQAFTDGLEQKRQRGDAVALPYFKRAVELDPNFAVAYAWRGLSLRSLAEVKPGLENIQRAYDLRDRATQRQRFYIDGTYFRVATGDREKAIQTFTDWINTYPRDPEAHGSLSAVLNEVGQYEKAALEARESIRLLPTAAAYGHELGALLRLERLDEARAALQEEQNLNIGSHLLPLYEYMVAFSAGDTTAIEEQVRSVTGISRGGVLCIHSYAQAFYGRFAREHELLGQVQDLARHDNAPDFAADCLSADALQEVEAGNWAAARQQAATALALSSGRDIQACAALALARAGDVAGAEKLSRQLNQDHLQDTMMQYYSLPTIRAAVALQRNNPAEAIEILKVALPYELGGVSFANLYPAYLRGEAYLRAGQAEQAAMEFQKLLDHPGVVGLAVLGPLSHLQLARAQVMMGNKDAARKSYQDFLTLWKDADPDVPIYKQAKAEYANLR